MNVLENKDTFTIIQISDTHLFADDNETIFGVQTNENFHYVLRKINENHPSLPDVFFLTGDVSQDMSEASYMKALMALETFNRPVFWIPGNHDDISIMKKIFGRSHLFQYLTSLNLGNWKFIFLNTKHDGSECGYLNERELTFLKREIIENSFHQKSIALVMHHHPIKTNTLSLMNLS